MPRSGNEPDRRAQSDHSSTNGLAHAGVACNTAAVINSADEAAQALGAFVRGHVRAFNDRDLEALPALTVETLIASARVFREGNAEVGA